MSENITPYQTAIQVEAYRRSSWMLEKQTLEAKQKEAMRILQLLAAIRHFEVKYSIAIRQSQTNVFDLAFPEMKRKSIHRADICKRAALRLRQAYNNLINDISPL
jgi:hypothetical protein